MSARIGHVLVAALMLATSLGAAGCLGKDTAPAIVEDATGGVQLSNRTFEAVSAVAAKKPLRYAFPAQGATAASQAVAYFNGTVGPEANLAFEAAQDRGGTSFNTVIATQDFSQFVPAGQPTLVNIRLWFDNGPARAADIDIHVDAYGVKTHENRQYADEMTWTLPVKTMSVTTIGNGQPTLIGIQAANGRLAPGQQINYWMRIEFLYGSDVAAPKVPYALQVPQNVTGLVVESMKFAGDTHVQGTFLVISPTDELVAAVAFDDIAIPTQSIYVPVSGPGEYVFYIVNVKNGFFSVRADAPLDDNLARALPRVVNEQILVSEPVAPGTARHYVYDPVTDYQEGTSKDFSIDGTFPLEVEPYIQGEGVTGDVELRVHSSAGLVALYHRFARYDSAQGTIGVSDEDAQENRAFFAQQLRSGPHKLSAVVNGMSGQAGVRVFTYSR